MSLFPVFAVLFKFALNFSASLKPVVSALLLRAVHFVLSPAANQEAKEHPNEEREHCKYRCHDVDHLATLLAALVKSSDRTCA